jgi:hypothetical protein
VVVVGVSLLFIKKTLNSQATQQQMAMETKDKYITPKTEVLELQTEGIIADSYFDPDSGAGIDY